MVLAKRVQTLAKNSLRLLCTKAPWKGMYIRNLRIREYFFYSIVPLLQGSIVTQRRCLLNKVVVMLYREREIEKVVRIMIGRIENG